jgi:hypothetical protein
MPYSVTGTIGQQWLDTNPPNGRTFALGNSFIGEDGHLYVYARASGSIAANATVVLTEPAFTAATGAGAFTAGPTAMVLNDTGWFRKTAI